MARPNQRTSNSEPSDESREMPSGDQGTNQPQAPTSEQSGGAAVPPAEKASDPAAAEEPPAAETPPVLSIKPPPLGIDPTPQQARRPLAPSPTKGQDPPKPVEAEHESATGRQPAGLVIICPYCKRECRAQRSEAFFTRYYCPDKLCGYSQKVPRPNLGKRVAAARAQEQDHSAR